MSFGLKIYDPFFYRAFLGEHIGYMRTSIFFHAIKIKIMHRTIELV